MSTRQEYVGAFDRWLRAMRVLGYEHREVYLNSMHAQAGRLPAPQSRDRLYVVFWRAGDRAPDLERWTRPTAWCPTHGQVQALQSWKNPAKRRGRYRAQYVYQCPWSQCRHQVLEPAWLPAAAAIDWSLRGQRIGDRARRLAAKTMARIRAGLDRYGRAPHIEAFRSGRPRAYPPTDPLATIVADGRHHALLVPSGGSWNESAQPVELPMRARTTRESDALLVPVEGQEGVEARPAADTLRTLSTRSQTGLLVMLRGENADKTTGQPFDTFAAAGLHHALIMRNNTARTGPAGQTTMPEAAKLPAGPVSADPRSTISPHADPG